MSILTNQTSINPTASFFALAGSGGGGGGVESITAGSNITLTGTSNNPIINAPTAPIIRYTLDPSQEPVSFPIGETVQVASFSIPDQYNEEDNFTFYCGFQLLDITPGGSFGGYVNVSLNYSSSSGTYSTKAPIFLIDGITTVNITLPPFIANTGNNYSTFSINVVNNTSDNFTANYTFFETYFLKLSSGGIEV
jgi:hypothetical protein